MSERIKNLSGIELGLSDGEHYLFVTSATLQQETRIPLEASASHTTHLKVLKAWIQEQLNSQTSD